MPEAFDTSVLKYIDPELAGSGYTPYSGTGEEFASTVPRGGYDDNTPMWAKRLAGFAAGFQNPSFGAQYLKDKEEERRRQAFLAQQNQSSQQFELRKAAVRAADEMRQLERQAALQHSNQVNLERLRTDEEVRKKAADDARIAAAVGAANLNKPEQFRLPSTYIGGGPFGGVPGAGVKVPVPLTTAEQIARIQLAPELSAQGTLGLLKARTTAEAGQADLYAAHQKLYNMLANEKLDDNMEITTPMLVSFEKSQNLPAGTYRGFKGMKIGQLKVLLGLAKPPTQLGMPLFGTPMAPGGMTTANPAAGATALPPEVDLR